ncbi:MAG: gamma-glutamyl-gamma-aminobutyrate hydrolase family protein [Pseudomonadota bacterium]
MPPKPIIAVTTCVKEMDNYRWHATVETYTNAIVEAAEAVPVLVPSMGERIDLDAVLDRVDGVIITGSRSNVHPSNYGHEETDDHGPFDHDRDATTLPLIRQTVERGVPLLAICRGIQEMNVALGGTLATEIQTRPGVMDHRAPEADHHDDRFAIRHPVRLDADAHLATHFGADEIQVNSLHRQAIDTLSEHLHVEARAKDGTIEAVRVREAKGFAFGVQWHPEYWSVRDDPSHRIFKAFGEAARAYHAQTFGLAAE